MYQHVEIKLRRIRKKKERFRKKLKNNEWSKPFRFGEKNIYTLYQASELHVGGTSKEVHLDIAESN